MLKTFFCSAPLTQGACLAAASFIFLFLGVAPMSNIVLNTYALAAGNFFAGTTPYTIPPAGSALDTFPYPPLWPMMFGYVMRLALLFPLPQWHATLQLWTLGNAFFFWWGMSRWIDLRRPQGFGFFVVVLAGFVELDTHLWYCQTNAIVLGMGLLGLADHRDGKPVSAAAWLVLATGLKVLPGFFIVPLFFRDRRFRMAAMGFGAAALLAPALVVGLAKGFAFWREWIGVFAGYANGAGRLDLGTVMGLYGLGGLGMFLRELILLVTLAVVFVESRPPIDYARWISIGFTAMLLASPRTEQPTFVYAVPAMWLLFARAPFVVSAASAIVSLHAWRLYQPTLPHGETKTFGTLVLWCVAVAPTLVAIRRAARSIRAMVSPLGKWRRLFG